MNNESKNEPIKAKKIIKTLLYGALFLLLLGMWYIFENPTISLILLLLIIREEIKERRRKKKHDLGQGNEHYDHQETVNAQMILAENIATEKNNLNSEARKIHNNISLLGDAPLNIITPVFVLIILPFIPDFPEFNEKFFMISLFLFIVLILARRAHQNLNQTPLGKCHICKTPTNDQILLLGNRVTNKLLSEQKIYYCRRHLIELFEKEFTSYPFKMVVCHPNFSKGYEPHFPCLSVKNEEQIDEWNFKQEEMAIIEEVLAGIVNKQCDKCEKPANVAYYSSIDYPDHGIGIIKNNLSSKPKTYLCNTHAFYKIENDIKNNPATYNDGGYLTLPYDEEVIYISTALY